MSKHCTRILLVDDHEIVRNSLQALLAREPDMAVVGTAVNGLEAVQLAQTTEPDVIVMDVSMPELDGIRAAGRIRELGIPARIIMLSMHHSSALVNEARKNGAAAYIIKQQAGSDLIPAIRAVQEGELDL